MVWALRDNKGSDLRIVSIHLLDKHITSGLLVSQKVLEDNKESALKMAYFFFVQKT